MAHIAFQILMKNVLVRRVFDRKEITLLKLVPIGLKAGLADIKVGSIL